jgi:uncharacterized membrane protein/mono/diheme cytochrome c family protein
VNDRDALHTKTFTAIVALALLAAPAAADPPLVFSAENVERFVGRTHAILVHFPIALLMVGAFLEILNAARRRMTQDASRQPSAISHAGLACIVIGALGACAAAYAGWENAEHEGVASSAESILGWHRWLGVGVAAASVFAALVGLIARAGSSFPVIALYRAVVVLAAAAVGVTGHLGGSMVYGEDYLIAAFHDRSAPSIDSQTLDGTSLADAGSSAVGDQTVTPVGATPAASPSILLVSRVQEIFDARCIDCHGSRRSKGDLRLDDIAAEPPTAALNDADPDASELLRRITLPPNHKQFMPEDGDPLAAAEIETIRRWLRSRAAPIATAAATPPTPTAPAIAAGSATPAPTPAPPSRPAREELPRVELSAAQRQAQSRAIAAIRAMGGHASPVASGSDLIRVNLTPMGKSCTDDSVAALAGLESSLHDLSLSGTAVTDAGLKRLAPFATLDRLDLSRSSITDAGVRELVGLPRLRSLNLHTSKISDAVADTLAAMPALSSVVLWRTAMTPDVASRLAAAKPDLRLEFGVDAPTPATPPAQAAAEPASAPTAGATNDPSHPTSTTPTPATPAPLLARIPGCCKSAKDAGRECDHPCCVAARADGKVCEKCLGGK